MIEARIGEILFVVLAGRGKAEDTDVPVEVARVPTKNERGEGGVTLGKLGVADIELERPDGPAARTGEGGSLTPTSTFMATTLGMTATA